MPEGDKLTRIHRPRFFSTVCLGGLAYLAPRAGPSLVRAPLTLHSVVLGHWATWASGPTTTTDTGVLVTETDPLLGLAIFYPDFPRFFLQRPPECGGYPNSRSAVTELGDVTLGNSWGKLEWYD